MVPETSNTIHSGSFRRHALRSDPGPSSAIIKLVLAYEARRGLSFTYTLYLGHRSEWDVRHELRGDELINLREM